MKNSWTKIGNLLAARLGHGVIQVDNEFIVVGGVRNHKGKYIDGEYKYVGGLPTESCVLNQQSMTCTTREPRLFKFSYYPELMLIP